MKKMTTNFLAKMMLGLAIAVTMFASQAAAQDVFRRHVEISFDFTAGDTQLSAGKYTVEPLNRNTAKHLYVIRNKDTNEQAIVPVTVSIATKMNEDAALSFNRYGDKLFLARINMGDNKFVALRSKAEREAEKAFMAQVKAQNSTSEVRD